MIVSQPLARIRSTFLLTVDFSIRSVLPTYIEALEGAGMCLMLATALHSIAVGNLLPARVHTVCVDMTESVPVQLSNRGTMQAIGLVTDVGCFLEAVAAEPSREGRCLWRPPTGSRSPPCRARRHHRCRPR